MVRSGWNLKSSKILRVSSLPASIKRIGSKATEKRWRHHFPHYKSLLPWTPEFWSNLPQNIMQPFPHPSGATCKIWSRLEIRTRPRFYACPCYMQVQKGSNQKQPSKGENIVFPIISQWGLSVAMETRILIQSALKPYAAFPPPQWPMLHIKFDQYWPTGFRDIQVWKCGRRQMDDRPLVYYKHTLWAFSSGELISLLKI